MAVDPIRGTGDPHERVAGAQTHALFEAHSRMVYGLCRALLRDPDDADDATQATFISAYRSLLGGNDVREAAAWLATIARNECTARAQARMREPLPLFEADVGQVPGPEAELDRKAVVAELQRAIAELPEKQREAVVLRDLYGLHYTEVGAALGMSVASVESLLFRARRSLRISLKPLAGGALAVPIAVREGIAQALPAFTAAGAAGGGAASGAVGLGMFAKLAGGPVAVKAAAGVAAAIAAGSIAVAGVERAAGPPRAEGRGPATAQASGVGDFRAPAAAVTSFVAVPAAGGSRKTSDGPSEGSGHREKGSDDDTSSGHGKPEAREAREASDDHRSTDGDSGSDDSANEETSGAAAGGGGSEHSSRSDGSSDPHGSDDSHAGATHDDVLDVEPSHAGEGSGEGDDSGSSGDPDEADQSGGSGDDEPETDEPSPDSSGHDSGDGSGHDEPLPPA